MKPHRLHPGSLCDVCRHRKVVISSRGSRFLLCRLAQRDPRFERYPPQPVLRCEGFERDEETS